MDIGTFIISSDWSWGGAKHIEILLTLKVKVEEESLRKYNVDRSWVIRGITSVERGEILDDITSADAVMCF